MSFASDNLALPFIQPSQALKHITHNEALALLDGIIHLVIAATLTDPPASPVAGQCVLVGSPAGGAFAAREGQVALFTAGAWTFLVPRPGWIAWFAESQRVKVLSQAGWSDVSAIADDRTEQLGIAMPADSINRLSVSSASSLFTHAGGSHRLVINKNAPTDVASLLFQTGYSGRAEWTLASGEATQLKISKDGQAWKTAIDVAANGVVRMPGRPMARVSYNEGEIQRPAGAYTGFTTFHVNQGGFTLVPFTNPVASTLGQQLVVPETGLYQIIMTHLAFSAGSSSLYLMINGSSTTVRAVDQDFSMMGNVIVHAHSLRQLNAGDRLFLVNASTVTLTFGDGKTELTLMMA